MPTAQPKQPNILFIMADQLRFDYLGCTGHPHIKTPNIDALAKNGVNFAHTYCQAPVCGASRMSFYTGRYVSSHGVTYNNVPLNIGEKTMGDYLREQGYRVALSGKTHMASDTAGMERLGVNPYSDLGVLASQCGFEPYWRDDGLHPDQVNDPHSEYNTYLRSQGYDGDNPWHDWANSAIGDKGEILSGWEMKHADKPARIHRDHSETAYTTKKAIEFMDECQQSDTPQPWCLHASYIKPHWPYVAPAPYNDMYNASHVVPANKCESERTKPHPVYGAYMNHVESINFSKEQVRDKVIPVYMGLITEFDDTVGKIVQYLKDTNQFDNTIIVITSDHGDYLGDHWLGEKDMMHDPSVRIPLIVHDPRPCANSSRGKTYDHMVEAIDLLPTFYDWAGGNPRTQDHVLEGASLAEFINDNAPTADNWRGAAIAEYDYSWQNARLQVGIDVTESHFYMVRQHNWKLVYFENFPCQLFNLISDPDERIDLGQCPDHAHVVTAMTTMLFDWLRHLKKRKTIANDRIRNATDTHLQRGFLIGVWEKQDIAHKLETETTPPKTK